MTWNWSEDEVHTTLPGELWGEDDDIPVTATIQDVPADDSAPEEALSEGQQTTFELLRDHGAELYEILSEALEERYGAEDQAPFDTHDESGYEADTRSSYETHAEGRYETDTDPGFGRPADQAPAADLFDSYDDYGETDDMGDEPFDERFSVQEIFIFPTSGPAAEWGVTISADFEPEHGIGVIFDYNVVDEVGYQEMVLAELR